MAVIGTLVASQPSGIGLWSECTLATAQVVGGTATATGTVVYTNTSAHVFQPSLPVACIVPTLATATSAATVAYTTIQNAINNGLPAGIGIASVVLGTTSLSSNTTTGLISYQESGTLTVGFVNYAAAATVTAGTRLLFIQSQGN